MLLEAEPASPTPRTPVFAEEAYPAENEDEEYDYTGPMTGLRTLSTRISPKKSPVAEKDESMLLYALNIARERREEA